MSTRITAKSQHPSPTLPVALTDLITRHPGYDFVTCWREALLRASYAFRLWRNES